MSFFGLIGFLKYAEVTLHNYKKMITSNGKFFLEVSEKNLPLNFFGWIFL